MSRGESEGMDSNDDAAPSFAHPNGPAFMFAFGLAFTLVLALPTVLSSIRAERAEHGPWFPSYDGEFSDGYWRICGNYCGGGWCAGEWKAEHECYRDGDLQQGDPSGPADACCKAHDECCGGPDREIGNCNEVLADCVRGVLDSWQPDPGCSDAMQWLIVEYMNHYDSRVCSGPLPSPNPPPSAAHGTPSQPAWRTAALVELGLLILGCPLLLLYVLLRNTSDSSRPYTELDDEEPPMRIFMQQGQPPPLSQGSEAVLNQVTPGVGPPRLLRPGALPAPRTPLRRASSSSLLTLQQSSSISRCLPRPQTAGTSNGSPEDWLQID